MKEALKSEERFFPPNAEATVVLEPGDGAFDGPAPFISTEGTSILSHGSLGTIGRDHFDTIRGKLGVKLIAVVGFVTNDALGLIGGEHEAKELLDQAAFSPVGGGSADGQRQSLGIDQDHDFDSLANPCATNAVASTFGLGEGSINETFVEPVAPLFFDKPAHRAHNVLEDSCLDPGEEPAMHAALGTEAFGQILPLGPVVEHPEYACQCLSFGNRRSAALWAGLKIRNQVFENIELFVTKCKHPNQLADIMPKSGFWDSL